MSLLYLLIALFVGIGGAILFDYIESSLEEKQK